MEDNKIYYRGFGGEDLPYLFRKAIEERGIGFEEPYSFNSMAQFSDWFSHRLNWYYHDFHIVSDEDGVIGYLYTYDYRIYDANCTLFTYAERRHFDLLYGSLCKLFNDYPLNKVFIWVRQDNKQTLDAIEKIVKEPEAKLTDYTFSDGTYIDVFVYGIPREAIIYG